MKDQLERAVVSVSNNIAEGFERGSYQELLTFLYYALGSAGEVRSMLLLIPRLPGGDALRPRVDELLPTARSVSRQLSAWIESLKNSPNRGPRYENASTRAHRKQADRARAFLDELERMRDQAKGRDPRDGQAE